MAHVYIVDDEAAICAALTSFLELRGHRATVFPTAEDALSNLAKDRPDAILLDLNLPGVDGISAIAQFHKRDRALPILLITAQGSPGAAIEAMKKGAYDYLAKPLDLDLVILRLEKAFEKTALSREVSQRSRGPGPSYESDLVGHSAAMQEACKRIGAVAESDATVLLVGESGTGKELAARALHRASGRKDGPFAPVNCAVLPLGILQSELFGHEKGAFTGAVSQKPGCLERADGGTLFLDEIGEMPAAMQTALLRFLEERSFLRVGGAQPIPVDVRIVAATHRNLERECAEGRFREDLYFRLHVVEIRLPPLRERLEDIPALAAHFLQGAQITERAMQVLKRHAWPGNVRELRHAIVHATTLAQGRPVDLAHLPETVLSEAKPREGDGEISAIVRRLLRQSPPGAVWDWIQAAWERPLIAWALQDANGNQTEAAERLGIHRSTLKAKMEQYGIGG